MVKPMRSKRLILFYVYPALNHHGVGDIYATLVV